MLIQKSNIPILEMKDVSKVFPGTIAVDKVNFAVKPGEIHALIGENGAGKSTLMKMIAGSFNDYTGEILINGEHVSLYSPSMAKENGIEMIYQELSLAKPITIAENVLAGRIPVKKKIFLDMKQLVERTRAVLAMVRLDYLDPLKKVEDLSQHEAQLVEIAKALGNKPKILVMDEPTSALSREEVVLLFDIIKQLKAGGDLSIIYISHHLPEIFEVADRVTVLRNGKHIATKDINSVTTEDLVEMMVGRKMDAMFAERKKVLGSRRIQVNGLSRYGFFHEISFHVQAGEVVGIGGLSGAGRSELGRSISGVDPVDDGEILLNGEKVVFKDMGAAIEAGVGYLTEDRKSQGLALRLSLSENIASTLIPRHTRYFMYNEKLSFSVVDEQIADLNIMPPVPAMSVSNFSGGNQQKILLAKWLAIKPQVLILDEPTRGVDIGAKVIIHKTIEKLAENGAAVILISSDLPELVGLSDRIMIMRKGHFIREMARSECTEESVLLAANSEGGAL